MKRRNIVIARTTRLMFRPVVLLDSKPKSSPIATTGITNQFSHPSNGMSATSAAIRATVPRIVEIRFMGLAGPLDSCLAVSTVPAIGGSAGSAWMVGAWAEDTTRLVH